jgi:vanillate O-demethylase ferredoxin subunit
MKPALRTPLLTLHLWIGLTVGVIFSVVALTGTALIFRARFERTLDAHRFIVEPGSTRLSLDDLVARAKAVHPGPAFLSVRYWGDPTMPFTAYFADKNYVHVNPYTGEILGTRARYGEGFGWLEGLHKYLTLEPKLGETVNGTLAFIFVALLGSGLVLWWPATRRALVAGLTINRKLSGRPWNLNLHKALGVYAAALLLFSAVSGIPISFESTRVVLDVLTLSKHGEAPLPTGATGQHFAGFAAVQREMEARMPSAIETYIPAPKNGLVAAYAIAADAPHPNARSYVYLEPSAKVLRFTPFAEAGAGYRLYYWMMSLHTGVAGGLGWQILLFFATLSVPVLAWTGIGSYRKRRSRAQVSAAAPLLNPEPVSAK